MPPGGGLHVVTAAPPAVRAPGDLASIAGAADLIELRLDLLLLADPELDVAAWIRAAPRPVLATVRSRAQGGMFTGTPQAAAGLLLQAAEAGAAWVDVEAQVAPHLCGLPQGTRRLASEHGPRALDVEPEVPAACDLAKYARPVDDAMAFTDLLGEAAQVAPRGFVVPYGRLAAARTLFVGSDRPGFLFGSARSDAPAARGQPSLDVLLEDLRAGEVTVRASLYGLVGEPPGRSPSPALHNAVFRARDADALYVPLPGFTLEEAMGLPVEGLSVTHPFKTRAAQLADALDPIARRVGAVNTLLRTPGGWYGANTDATGLHAVLPAARAGAAAFVYGAGGYAHAAVWALRKRGYDVRLGARHEPRGKVAAGTCGAAWAGEHYQRGGEDAVVVNATPAGADGADVAAFAGTSLADLVVLDAPYRDQDRETGMVAQARRDDACSVIDGRALLRAQARDQAVLFGAGAGALDLERILTAAVELPPTLILLGLRGAGKTTVGREVARRWGRPFVDLDAEVARVTGETPAVWIETRGWAAFRDVESRLLASALARRGIVLATGGGVVERAANRELLVGAGPCVHLAVPAEVAAGRVEASAVARPRLPGAASALDEARMLLERRTPLWRDVAVAEVDANKPVAAVVREVLSCWSEAVERS